MEMEIISRETIKPSSPTPLHFRTYPLSFIDNSVAPNSVPLIYHYPNETYQNGVSGQIFDQETKIFIIKNSLSKVLSIYYPLAGRLKDKIAIDCDDQGVSLLVTKITNNLSEILQNPKEQFLNSLFHDKLQWENMGSSKSLVAIQINGFACGGIAISVCMSHKVGDVTTLFNFVNDWASINRMWNNSQDGESTLPLTSPSPFPQGDLAVIPEFQFLKQNAVCKRLVFNGSKIESLKAIVTSHGVENPTRVEVVVALIYKCAVTSLGLKVNNAPLRVTINLRKRMVPPLPEKSLGNLVWSFYASKQRVENTETELSDVVKRTREGLNEFCDKYVKNFGDLSFAYEFLKQTHLPKKKELVGDSNSYEKKSLFFFASWCRFQMYEADFGWGKPIWVTSCGCPMRNTIILMDTRDGHGIEAIVNMEEKDMAVFECDELLLQFASLDPNRWK